MFTILSCSLIGFLAVKDCMRMKIEIELDNAAFIDNEGEIARILRKVAYKYKRIRVPLKCHKSLLDINGNKVGHVEVIDD